MKRPFDQLRSTLDEFVQQDEYPALVVGCRPDELAYVLKLLQSLEQTHPTHLIAAFHQPFPDAGSYVDGVVRSAAVQLEAAAPLRAERGEPPTPPLPLALMDPRRAPAQRLLDLLDFLRRLLPNEDEYRLVVGLLPLQCDDLAGYAELVRAILPIPDVPSWMSAVRIVAYDDRDHRPLAPILRAEQAERVLTLDVDFSPDAMADALARDAGDRSLPVPERMAALLQIAAIDYSYKRHQEALRKYGALHEHYAGANQPDMQALCLLGAGDTLHAAGDSASAKQRLQQGIAVAMEHRCLPVLLNLLISITGVCMALGHYADAESYADSGTKVAAAVLNPFSYCDLHEARGDAQLGQRKFPDGVASYQRCRELCRTYEHFHRWRSVLGKLARVYADAGMAKEQREVEDELAVVRELERRGAA